MSEYVIKSGVPIPPIKRPGAGNHGLKGSKYPLDKLEVGQSFDGVWLKTPSSLLSIAKKLAPKQFKVRRIDDSVELNGRKHFGVWRTA